VTTLGNFHDKFAQTVIGEISVEIFFQGMVHLKPHNLLERRVHQDDPAQGIGYQDSVGQRLDDCPDSTFFSSQVQQGSLPFTGRFLRCHFQSDFFRGPTDNEPQLIRFKGFGYKIISTMFHGLDGRFHSGISGNNNDDGTVVDFSDPFQNFHAVHARHFKIQQYNIGCYLLKNFQSFLTAGCLGYLEFHSGENTFRSFSNILLIVND